MGTRKIIVKVAYVVIVTTIVLVLSYLIVRTILQQRRYAALPDYGDLVRYDLESEGGHLVPRLNVLAKGENTSRAVRFITNAKGFRSDKEFSYAPSPKTFRILFLGDSYVDGMRTDQQDTIGYLLERKLNERPLSQRFGHYEVMISGHNNPADAWYYYQQHGYKYQPHLVLLGVTIGNDLTWNSYRTTFVPVKDKCGHVMLECSGSNVSGDQKAKDLVIPEDGYIEPGGEDGYLGAELRARNLLAERAALFDYAVPPVLYPLPSRPRYLYATDFSVSAGLFYVPLMPQIETIYRDVEEMLLGLDATVTKTGSRLGVVFFPVRIQLRGRDWELLKKFYLLNETKFDLDYPQRRLVAFCGERNILCSDVLPAMQKAAYENPALPLYRPRGDMHFNERGQQLAADELDEFMRTILR